MTTVRVTGRMRSLSCIPGAETGLTIGCAGRTGHLAMTWPSDPQSESLCHLSQLGMSTGSKAGVAAVGDSDGELDEPFQADGVITG